MILRLAGVLGLLFSAGLAEARAVREPTGRWTVDFAESQCVAMRSYGSADKPLFLLIKVPPLGDVKQVAFTREGWTSPEEVEGTISFDRRPPVQTSMLMFSPPKSSRQTYLVNMPSAGFAPIQGAKSITVRTPGFNETFSLSQMGPLIKVLDECVADLRRAWNVQDPSGSQSSNLKRAQADLKRFVRAEDYPAVSIQNRNTGRVRFVMLIDEKGRVQDCTIIETSGVAALDTQACAVMKQRAKFEPAIGTDGKPAKDALTSAIQWKLR